MEFKTKIYNKNMDGETCGPIAADNRTSKVANDGSSLDNEQYFSFCMWDSTALIPIVLNLNDF